MTVKYDNTAPTIQDPTVEGEGQNGWYRENVQIRINGDDVGSGLDGYWYYLNGSETGLHEKDINVPITVNADGITTVRVKTVDKAGNESNLMEKTIKIDKEGPKFESGIEKSQVGETGFTINVLATDSLSRKLKIQWKSNIQIYNNRNRNKQQKRSNKRHRNIYMHRPKNNNEI